MALLTNMDRFEKMKQKLIEKTTHSNNGDSSYFEGFLDLKIGHSYRVRLLYFENEKWESMYDCFLPARCNLYIIIG